MTDPPASDVNAPRRRRPRRWLTIAGEAVYLVVLLGGLELQDWAEERDV